MLHTRTHVIVVGVSRGVTTDEHFGARALFNVRGGRCVRDILSHLLHGNAVPGSGTLDFLAEILLVSCTLAPIDYNVENLIFCGE